MIIYFDTETTSICPGQICQLSYIMECDENISYKNFYFKVQSMSYASTMVTGLTKADLEILSGGKVFSDSIDEIADDFESASIIISHNFNFDYSFMQEEYSRCERLFCFNNSMCSMRKFTPVLKLPRKSSKAYKYPKLSELIDAYGVTQSDIQICMGDESLSFHNALYDTFGLYLALKNARAKLPDFDEFMIKYI